MSIPVLETGLVSQRVISEEIGKIHAGAAASETQPRLDVPLADGTREAAS